jgi:N-acyl-D-glutamate deacylase
MPSRIFAIIIVVSFTVNAFPAQEAQQVKPDLILANGRVLDPESGLDAVRHVAITNGKIVAVSATLLEGKEVVDVKGLVVAPGCIDLHSHSQELPGARMQACDGVTTHLELEAGVMPISAYYDRLAKEGRPINYGASVSWAVARIAAIHNLKPEGSREFLEKGFLLTDWTEKLATQEQEDQIIDLIDKGLKDGGVGIGLLAGYSPEFGKKENFRIHQLAAKYKVPVFTHIRFTSMIEPRSSFEAYQEVVAMAASTGAHVHICHFNSSSAQDIEICARMIADAQKRLKITTEAYPYGAGSTGINAAFFRNPNWTKRFKLDYSDMVYLKTGERLTKERMKEIQEKDPSGLIIIHFLDPENRPGDQALLDRAVLFPGGAIASDAMPWQVDGKTLHGDVWPLPEKAIAHPRTAGCFSRVLGHYVRERKVLSLMDAVKRCSLIPAQILEESTPQMKNKGRIKVGADADIIVFDADKIGDRATFANPRQTSVGFRLVLVNGTVVVRDGELVRTAFPGRPIRREKV